MQGWYHCYNGFLLHHEVTEVVFNRFLIVVSSCKPEIMYLFIVFTPQTSQLFYLKNISRIIQAWNHRQEAEERFPGILLPSSCLFWVRRKYRGNILADVLLLPSNCFKQLRNFLALSRSLRKFLWCRVHDRALCWGNAGLGRNPGKDEQLLTRILVLKRYLQSYMPLILQNLIVEQGKRFDKSYLESL